MHTLILAFIQSITEFLPISSSAHLILWQFLMEWKPQGLMMDIGLHIGTLLSVCVYFYKDLLSMLKAIFIKKSSKSLIVNLMVATLPIPIFGLILLPQLRQLRRPDVIAIMLIVFGIILWLADRYSPQKSDDITIRKAFYIGVAQCLSLIPGVSRSGVTITMARLCGIRRSQAARFSMLLSIPTIFLAGLWAFLKCWQNGSNCTFTSMSCLGIFYSFIFGLIVIRLFMRFVKSNSFLIFMFYRLVVGMFILLHLWL